MENDGIPGKRMTEPNIRHVSTIHLDRELQRNLDKQKLKNFLTAQKITFKKIGIAIRWLIDLKCGLCNVMLLMSSSRLRYLGIATRKYLNVPRI